MIGYVTLGTNDLPRAAAFYDAIAAHFGLGRMMDFDSFIAWGEFGGAPGIAATVPFDGQPATVGNGVMVALEVKSPEQVHAVYDTAIAHGGKTGVLDRPVRVMWCRGGCRCWWQPSAGA